ncbi:DNA primase [Bordetella holmesii]|uniref:DNA primase n=2 Tax=Bordetella holmesii TaxID=35814 RepID=A0A158M828_9BORD|nr:DNA primase [Bordetella holmesii]EWM47420.1 DNA primase [Bordetella holmesii 35009]AMD45773.1 DNA primase [Bordetella holmesii H558]AMD48809.1 DNA primase [Bordetella holmesii F627]AOB34661.1 DNA primase [Bordetella holmesii]AUL18673.1 DNA primase [Bordetella holmesii]
MIPESFIQDLLARVDVVDVIGRYVQLRKGGANLLGLCPFHNEKSPSFTVSPTKQFYHCFGCGAHGSAITFLMEHTGANFPEAVRTLAASAGMTVPEESRSPRQQAESARRKAEVSRHTQVLDAAQAHYLRLLRSSPDAIAYLKQRGLTGSVAKAFGLGWAGTDRHGLAKVFDNYDDPTLVEAGLVIESEDGRRYDRFRERVMFPIRNTRGSLIGFGGRIIGKGEPKYLNSPETPVFSKGHELYGLWEARLAIRQEGVVIVVEGYMDVVGLAQLGIGNAVATLGTSTTPDHVKKLLRTSDKVVFSFDGDAAGRRAAWRALQACLPVLRDDIAIRFLFLPAEHDPDSYVREFGAEAFREQMGQASALSRFLLDELASRHNLGEAEGRASCLHEAKPLLAGIPECGLKTQIERELARLVQLTPEEMSQALAQFAAQMQAQAAARQQVQAGQMPAETVMPAVVGRSDSAVRVDEPPPDWAYEPISDADHDVYSVGAMGDGGGWHSGSKPQAGYKSRGDWKGKGERKGDWKGRGRRDDVGGYEGRRVMPSLARRLLCLLLAHPELVDTMGDQQLEVIDHGPNLGLVRDLIVLAQASGARHVGALMEAADPDSDLYVVLKGLRADMMAQEDLPEPLTEWNDALRRIEIDILRGDMTSLVNEGLQTEEARKRYAELRQRLAVLSTAGLR